MPESRAGGPAGWVECSELAGPQSRHAGERGIRRAGLANPGGVEGWGDKAMPRAAQLSVRGFGHRWRGGAEMLGGFGQRLFEGLGVALVLVGLLLLLALLTYNPRDISLDTAVDAPPHNFLGRDGALIADLLVQSVGLAAYLVPAVLLGWAIRLLLGQAIRRPLRAIA